ncbi:MAG: hypothetical protein QW756_04490 [Nitrososphaerota archaeon]
MAVDLKRELLRLLDEDEEFRYAVAGRIGILEILRRLDRLEEGQNKLWENQNRLWEEVRSLREGQNKLWENTNRLWENQNRLWEEVRDMRVTLNRVAVTLDRLTISVEEEALSFIKHRLKTDMGIDVKLTRIFIDSREINIYGCSEDVCVVGEAAVRLGTGLVEELLNKIDLLKSRRPDLLRAKLIKAIYTDYATPDSLEYARERGVWVLKWSGDLTPMKIEYS